jgi:RNA polymerase sigma-70 factor, ECF subfamily
VRSPSDWTEAKRKGSQSLKLAGKIVRLPSKHAGNIFWRRTSNGKRVGCPMLHAKASDTLGASLLSDVKLVELALQRHPEALRFIMRRHSRRLYRVARAILGDDSEAEDVVQEVYVRAFTSLATFRVDSSLSTWLTRIAINEAIRRRRQQKPMVDLTVLDTLDERDRIRAIPFSLMKTEPDPEQAAAQQEIRRVLEQAIDNLAEHFRIVFVMRDIEGMSVEETAAHLGLRSETVRTRLHRARAELREALKTQLASTLREAFPFAGVRCARIASSVLQRLGVPEPLSPETE